MQRHRDYVEAERERGRRTAGLWRAGVVCFVTWLVAEVALLDAAPSGLVLRAVVGLLILAATVLVTAIRRQASWRRTAYVAWAGALFATVVALMVQWG